MVLSKPPFLWKIVFHGDGGFTLLELVAVVGIVAVLAGVGIVNFQKSLVRSRNDAAIQTLKAVASAERVYKLDHGSYGPATGTPSLTSEGLIDAGWGVTDGPHDPGIVTAVTYRVSNSPAPSTSAFLVSVTIPGAPASGCGTITLDQSGTFNPAYDPGSGTPAGRADCVISPY